MKEQEIQFTSGTNHLIGTMTTPVTPAPWAVLVLVHGSGPVDRSSNGYFRLLHQHFAHAGYAVLSYDKPGVGGSSGDWTQQSFADRAHEVAAAVHFLQNHSDINLQYVGLCGGSQAGWIMPLAYQLAEHIAFIISISAAAVLVYEQEAYRTEQQLRVDGYSEEQIQRALQIFQQRLDMIHAGATTEQIIAMQNESQNEPWFSYFGDTTLQDVQFFRANCDFDPIPYLQQVRCPFLGIWGALDTFVPVEQSIKRTRSALEYAGNNDFELKIFPQADHGLRVTTTGSPKERGAVFAPGYLETMTTWLANIVQR